MKFLIPKNGNKILFSGSMTPFLLKKFFLTKVIELQFFFDILKISENSKYYFMRDKL